jgi:hypothetical protein
MERKETRERNKEKQVSGEQKARTKATRLQTGHCI